MKDKITAQVLDAVKKIEKEEVTFEKRLQCLLDEYKNIYKPGNFTFEDLIARKWYLQKSVDDFNSIFVSVCISGLISCFVSMVTTCYFQNKDCIQITIIGSILIVPITIILVLISCALYKMILQNRKDFDRYGTYEFEMQIIDEILTNRGKNEFTKTKNSILNSVSLSNINLDDEKEENNVFDTEEVAEQENTNQSDNLERES